MNLNFTATDVIVTGGSKGIGFGITESLLREGAIPVIVSRNRQSIDTVGKEFEDKGQTVFSAVAELTDPDQCKSAVESVIEKFGRIDGLVNNAGVNDGVGLENGNYEDFMKSIQRNLTHYYLMANYA